ncbi:MAG: DUF2202 domain-containing protein [Dactylosporangium sp.]|nr:DUF2202 domain-containing protein [Dactylosporangium sp.]
MAVSPAVASTVSHPLAAITGNGPGDGPGDGTGYGRGGRGPNADPSATPGDGTRLRDGSGYGPGNGPGMRDGTCDCLTITADQGTLTEAQRSTVAAMAQEEKLAHDLYVAFAAKYDTNAFDRIANAESQHLTAVRALMDRYEITDPTAGQPDGTFSDSTVQATYDRLLAQGTAGEQQAFEVGRTVEQTDIDDLQQALEGLSAADVKQVYTHLLDASRRHLAAFDRWATR